MQAQSAGPADARRRHRRPDAGQEQGLGRIDVADADHHVAGQQHLLDRRAALLQAGVEGL